MAKSSKVKAGKASKKKAAKRTAKTAGKKAASKKAGAKKASKKKAGKKGALGCCTLRGSGPDTQIEGITREACRLRAIELNKNFSWVAGKCAEPF